MMQMMTRGLALLMVLVMCLAFLPSLFLGTSAAEFSYVYDGKYIYNWGTRGTVATFLSPNAEDFYDENATSYDALSAYSGGTGKSDAPSSALYKALKDLMVSNHSHITNYSETRQLYRYTDCQNNGGKISSFYSGTGIGPSWDGNWNREHTWPNSKGLGGNDENDIMMLRPTSASENSSRGNTAYGKSGSYYNPNSESGGKYDLRGDVARIFLYVYVRWGNTNKAWGSSGVMESVDVLLEWMEEDPVDTWEIGRNDSVESITGTRNVFVDYPEFAFLLFGAEIPADMSTPSGEASGSGTKCDHNNFDAGVVIAPTCTEKGYTVYTCLVAGCGYNYKSNTTAAIGHQYTDGVCSACGESEPVLPSYVTAVEVGKPYKLGLHYDADYFFTGSIINNYYGATDSNYDNGTDVYLEQAGNGYHLYFKNSSNQKQYINVVASGTYRNFTISSTATSVFTWDASKNTLKTTVSGDVCYFGNYGAYSSMNILTEAKLKDTDYIAHLYTKQGASSDTPSDNPSCQHNYTTVVTNPTCTKEGFTTYTCTLCNHSYVANKVSAKGHSYSNGTCTNCGATQPSGTETTITFDDSRTGRTVFNSSQQVWVQNGITVTNDKASSTSDVADYSKPVRFYMGSNVTIAFPGMTKIVINCAGLDSKYADSWLNVTGATATKSNGIITIVFDTPTDSITYTSLAKQSRAYSITVYAEAQEPECQHTNTTVEGAMDVTCTTDGHTGKTLCLDCSAVLDEGEVLPSTGHVFDEWTTIKAPSCSAAGLDRRDCDSCTYYETKQIAALDHNDANSDEICDVCNKNLHKDEETVKPETPDDDTTTETEEHVCKEVSGFQAFINMIINFFRSLFGQPALCPCGEIILEKKN